MKIKIFPLTADAATLAQQQRQQQQQRRRRSVMKLQRKHKMPEICSWLIVAAAATAASATWLTLAGISAVAAQEDDISDSEMHQHHMDLLHHQQQHSDFIIGESEERDHIAHHLGELSNGDKGDMKFAELFSGSIILQGIVCLFFSSECDNKYSNNFYIIE